VGVGGGGERGLEINWSGGKGWGMSDGGEMMVVGRGRYGGGRRGERDRGAGVKGGSRWEGRRGEADEVGGGSRNTGDVKGGKGAGR